MLSRQSVQSPTADALPHKGAQDERKWVQEVARVPAFRASGWGRLQLVEPAPDASVMEDMATWQDAAFGAVGQHGPNLFQADAACLCHEEKCVLFLISKDECHCNGPGGLTPGTGPKKYLKLHIQCSAPSSCP